MRAGSLRFAFLTAYVPDESDNHIVELAVAGGAEAIVTHNRRDFERAELSFPGLQIVTPRSFVEEE